MGDQAQGPLFGPPVTSFTIVLNSSTTRAISLTGFREVCERPTPPDREDGLSTDTVVTTKYRGTCEYYLVFARLLDAARHRGYVTYQELAREMGLPLTGSHMGTATGRVLGEISEDEHKAGRPMLSALAVSVKGQPGPGFFGLARSLGLLASEDRGDELKFWEAQKSACYETWRERLSS